MGIFSRTRQKIKTGMNLHVGFHPTKKEYEKEKDQCVQLCVLGLGTIVFLGIFGSAIVGNAITLSILTSAGFGMIVIKSPKWVPHIVCEFDLFFDAVATAASFFIYGTSVTGLISAGMTCILFSACLKINKVRIYKELRSGK